MRFDIIGDVHGHADALEALLQRLGYRVAGGAFRHPGGRQIVFLGDLVDRGPQQVRAIGIARHMIEAGSALIVMGNHEFNAIAFATPDPQRPGDHLRPRRGSSVDHHAGFLAEVGGVDSPRHRELIAFFSTMPLWLDLDGLSIVHACWSGAHLAALAPHVDGENRLTGPGLLSALTKGTAAHLACEILLKGPEILLPPGIAYRDGQNSRRKTTRTRWWDAAATTVRAAAVERSVAEFLPDDPLPPDARIVLDERQPVLFGHYCLGDRPHLLTPAASLPRLLRRQGWSALRLSIRWRARTRCGQARLGRIAKSLRNAGGVRLFFVGRAP